MSETSRPPIPNMPQVQQTFDGLMAVTTAPLMDVTGAAPASVPVAGVVLAVTRGVISGVIGYFGDPDAPHQAEKMIGCNAAQVAASAGIAVIAALNPEVSVPLVILGGSVALFIDQYYSNFCDWMADNFDWLKYQLWLQQTDVEPDFDAYHRLMQEVPDEWRPKRRDPLILDLNGDGINTISVRNGTYFG